MGAYEIAYKFAFAMILKAAPTTCHGPFHLLLLLPPQLECSFLPPFWSSLSGFLRPIFSRNLARTAHIILFVILTFREIWVAVGWEGGREGGGDGLIDMNVPEPLSATSEETEYEWRNISRSLGFIDCNVVYLS